MLPENPELYGLGAIAVALITAWSKMKPALKEIVSKDDNSLRTDLLARINSLEASEQKERARHNEEVNHIRREYEATIAKLTERSERISAEYELKLKAFQEKVDLLMDALLESKHIVEKDK